jgi:hypothetical protein
MIYLVQTSIEVYDIIVIASEPVQCNSSTPNLIPQHHFSVSSWWQKQNVVLHATVTYSYFLSFFHYPSVYI